jgi:hypothetical protein
MSNMLLYYMMENTTINTSKYFKQFVCEKRDFSCCKKGDYTRHLNSKKHNTLYTTKIQPKILHSCECGKQYTHRATLFNHKKKCIYKEPLQATEITVEPTIEYLFYFFDIF